MAMTDADFMLAVLSETPDEWVTQAEILRRSQGARGCGMTVHSRASDLRNRGLVIENRVDRREGTRALSSYRLVTTSLSSAPVSVPAAGIGADESEDGLDRPGASADREPSFSSESEARTSLDPAGDSDAAHPSASPVPLFGDERQTRRPAWA